MIEKDKANVVINTTFSGDHAKFILDLEKKYEVNKPTALRLFITQYLNNEIFTLNQETIKYINELIKNPIVREQFGITSIDTFLEMAVSKFLSSLSKSLGTLHDPATQVTLTQDEKEVARSLLLMAQDLNYYGGVTVEEIKEKTNLASSVIKSIILSFKEKGWILQTGKEKYLPKSAKSLEAVD